MFKLKKSLVLACALMSISGVGKVAFASQNDSIQDFSEPTLVDGEILVGDTIVGVPFVSDVNSPLSNAKSSSPNYASSSESAQLYYSGYIQFRPSYVTKSTDGHGLVEGRQVSQAWLDYRRNEKSVIGGNKYTTVASSKTDNSIHSQSASCWDDILDWGESGRTYFYRGWLYFAK